MAVVAQNGICMKTGPSRDNYCTRGVVRLGQVLNRLAAQAEKAANKATGRHNNPGAGNPDTEATGTRGGSGEG